MTTPVYVILFWTYGVFLFGYFYFRVRGRSGRDWMAGVLTGLYAAFSASLVENAFNAMGFYRSAESFPMVGYVPLYVSLGWGLTFALMPDGSGFPVSSCTSLRELVGSSSIN